MNTIVFTKIKYLILRFIMFFSIIAFCLSCNIMLFLELLRRAVEIEYTEESIHFAALFTFWNAVFLGVAITLVDLIRRRIAIERPVKQITDATSRIKNGDFSVRIKPTRIPLSINEFNPIIHDINKMTQELAGIEALRSDFIATVSHELKTPLAVLRNYGTLLQDTELDEGKRLEYAKSIINVTGFLSEMITNILKLNKLENQNIYPTLTKCNLSELICECLIGFENEWESKNINIITDIESDIFINTDRELLSLAWNNLFSNAIKFTPSDGTVTVTLKEQNGYITATVSDTGCGMDSETQKHIFEKFYQGDQSHSTKGNGLGLALVKRVFDILDGEISFKSAPDKGTTFTVTLIS